MAKSGVGWLSRDICGQLARWLISCSRAFLHLSLLRVTYNNPKDFENIIALSRLINIQAIMLYQMINRYLHFNLNTPNSPQLCAQFHIQVRTIVHSVQCCHWFELYCIILFSNLLKRTLLWSKIKKKFIL